MQGIESREGKEIEEIHGKSLQWCLELSLYHKYYGTHFSGYNVSQIFLKNSY